MKPTSSPNSSPVSGSERKKQGLRGANQGAHPPPPGELRPLPTLPALPPTPKGGRTPSEGPGVGGAEGLPHPPHEGPESSPRSGWSIGQRQGGGRAEEAAAAALTSPPPPLPSPLPPGRPPPRRGRSHFGSSISPPPPSPLNLSHHPVTRIRLQTTCE